MKNKLTGIACVFAMALYVTPAVADDYSEAYKCAMESFQSGYGSGPAGFCVGNSRDPSLLEEQAYEAAERDFKSGQTAQVVQCPFEFAIWIANGSRSHSWLEGAQAVQTLDVVADFLSSGSDIFLYDSNGNRLSTQVINRLFVRQGEKVLITQEAAQQCQGKLYSKDDD